MHDALLQLLSAREGHFGLESGHHGTLWLNLELLFLRPRAIQPFVRELARRLSTYPIDAVYGPLVEGASVAQVAAALLRPLSSSGDRRPHPSACRTTRA